MTKAFLIDYDRCFGCHACEVACQMHNGLPTDQFGVKVNLVGPWEYEPKTWQYDYVPHFTRQCDMCLERMQEGKLPTCVSHCCGNALEVGEVEELAKKVGPKKILQVL